MANPHIRIIGDTWVRPYIELMHRLGCKGKAAAVIAKFVMENGMRPA